MVRISRSFGSSPRRARSWGSGMLTAPGTLSTLELDRLAHVEEERAVGLAPVGERHVAAQDVTRDHSREVDRVLRASELGGVAHLDLFEIVDARAHLDGDRQGADPLVHRRSVLAQALRPEDAAVGFPEEDLQPEHLGAGVVAGVGVREEVDLLVVPIAEPPERLLADAGPGGGASEQSDDRGPLGAAVAGIAPGDHVGRDPALPVRRPGEGHEAPLAGMNRIN